MARTREQWLKEQALQERRSIVVFERWEALALRLDSYARRREADAAALATMPDADPEWVQQVARDLAFAGELVAALSGRPDLVAELPEDLQATIPRPAPSQRRRRVA